MRNKSIKAVIASALLLGLGLTGIVNKPSQADAAKKSSYITFVKKSYDYNNKGKRLNVSWKKGLSVKTYGTRTIAGKKYYVIKDPMAVYAYPFYAYVRTTNAVKGKVKLASKKKAVVNNKANVIDDSENVVSKPKLTQAEWKKQAAELFIEKVNVLRVQKGLQPLQNNNSVLQSVANTRIYEITTQFERNGKLVDHSRLDGRKIYTLFDEKGLNGTHLGEVYGIMTSTDDITPEQFAQRRFYRMIYDDAGSNWGHRDILLSVKKPFTQIAVSVGFANVNGRIWAVLVVDLYW